MAVMLTKGQNRWFIPEGETGLIREAIEQGWTAQGPLPPDVAAWQAKRTAPPAPEPGKDKAKHAAGN